MHYRRYRAPRVQKPSRTDEQSRRLKVDVRKIPVWEAEIAAITESLRKMHPLDQIAQAWRNIVEALPEDERTVTKHKNEIEDWLRNADSSRIYSFSDAGVGKGYVDRDGLERNVKTRLAQAESFLQTARAKGTSNSGWSQLFRGTIDPIAVAETNKEKQRLLKIVPKFPEVTRANSYLDAVRASYQTASAALDKIYPKLWLAYEKKRAIENFEKTHGNALAKAAGVDKGTRQRAGGLKGIVARTNDCPYCSIALREDAQLDHIYPVHMGGLSTIENLVWCCAPCNQRKRGKGLLLFLREADLPVDIVIQRLHKLGKHI